jgi:NitT/TauT family transport system ATP-binding protein
MSSGARMATPGTFPLDRVWQTLLTYVPLVPQIRRVLDERPSHKALASRFRDELEDHISEEDAEQTLRAVISFAR